MFIGLYSLTDACKRGHEFPIYWTALVRVRDFTTASGNDPPGLTVLSASSAVYALATHYGLDLRPPAEPQILSRCK